jgi:hypothetical protein
MRRMLLAAGLLLGVASQTRADLMGVNWAADVTADGLASGTLGPLAVTLTSTDGTVNGGFTFPADWPNQAGTNGVPGIAALAGANRNAIDWNAGSAGVATITFTGGSATNPILLFDFTDPGETFDFEDALSLSILDQSPAGSVSIAAGNVVTLNGAPSNGPDDGFALQLQGAFTTFTFATNLNLLSAQSVGFSIAAEVIVPEPASMALMSAGMLGLLAIVRRRRGPA